MILYSIMPENIFKHLIETGSYRCSQPPKIEGHNLPYRWMTDQMIQRIGSPNWEEPRPVWAWYKFTTDKTKPDLRFRLLLPIGSIGYRVEIDVDEKEVLLSCMDGWIHVLNNQFFSYTEKGYDLFDSQHKSDLEERKRRTEKSWLKLFDLNFELYDRNWLGDTRSIQATLWEIRQETIKKADRFISR